MENNLKAFLDMIAHSEIGAALLAVSDNGYDIVVGSTPNKPNLLPHYDDCNRQVISLGDGIKSTASGRYQLLARYYDAYKKQLNLIDFSPDNQDAIAIQQIKERGALPDIASGDIPVAIAKCNTIWASLSGSPYGQHTNSLASLLAAYTAAGGLSS